MLMWLMPRSHELVRLGCRAARQEISAWFLWLPRPGPHLGPCFSSHPHPHPRGSSCGRGQVPGGGGCAMRVGCLPRTQDSALGSPPVPGPFWDQHPPPPPSPGAWWAMSPSVQQIPIPLEAGQTRGCDWYRASCPTGHPLIQQHFAEGLLCVWPAGLPRL